MGKGFIININEKIQTYVDGVWLKPTAPNTPNSFNNLRDFLQKSIEEDNLNSPDFISTFLYIEKGKGLTANNNNATTLWLRKDELTSQQKSAIWKYVKPQILKVKDSVFLQKLANNLNSNQFVASASASERFKKVVATLNDDHLSIHLNINSEKVKGTLVYQPIVNDSSLQQDLLKKKEPEARVEKIIYPLNKMFKWKNFGSGSNSVVKYDFLDTSYVGANVSSENELDSKLNEVTSSIINFIEKDLAPYFDSVGFEQRTDYDDEFEENFDYWDEKNSKSSKKDNTIIKDVEVQKPKPKTTKPKTTKPKPKKDLGFDDTLDGDDFWNQL